MEKQLPNVTLLAMISVKIGDIVRALKHSLKILVVTFEIQKGICVESETVFLYEVRSSLTIQEKLQFLGSLWIADGLMRILFCGCKHKNEMERQGMRWAPLEVAVWFSHETDLPENEGITSFAFHKFWNQNEDYKKYIQPIRFYIKSFFRN